MGEQRDATPWSLDWAQLSAEDTYSVPEIDGREAAIGFRDRWVAGESLQQLAEELGITPEGMRKKILRADPEAAQARRQAAEDRRDQARAIRIETNGLLAEIRLVRSAMAGFHCRVCGWPLAPNRHERGACTCDSRCSYLWGEVSYHIDEVAWQKHRLSTCSYDLRNPDKLYDRERSLTTARRVVAGETTADHGRWVTSARRRNLLREVEKKRQEAKAYWGSLVPDFPAIRSLQREPRSMEEYEHSN